MKSDEYQSRSIEALYIYLQSSNVSFATDSKMTEPSDMSDNTLLLPPHDNTSCGTPAVSASDGADGHSKEHSDFLKRKMPIFEEYGFGDNVTDGDFSQLNAYMEGEDIFGEPS